MTHVTNLLTLKMNTCHKIKYSHLVADIVAYAI